MGSPNTSLTSKLGVDAIWLTPIQPSQNADYGYDVADYRDISPEYGSLDDFNRMMAEAKKHNIRIILDMVMNHTSDKNAWFVQSRSSRTDPYRNWYVWRDGKGETATSQGGPPNNWGGIRAFGMGMGSRVAPVLLPPFLCAPA